MINLTVAMLRLILANVLVIPLLGVGFLSQVTPGLYITSPRQGDSVQGVVQVIGSLPEDKFQSGELSYAFAGGQTPTWFIIAKFEHPNQDEVLASWDTTTITDGTYQLRLTVNFMNGKSASIDVQDIRVANYTRVEVTSTMVPIGITTVPIATASSESQPSTPTPFAANPASIKSSDVLRSLGTGVFLGVLSLVVIGIYSFIRNRSRR